MGIENGPLEDESPIENGGIQLHQRVLQISDLASGYYSDIQWLFVSL